MRAASGPGSRIDVPTLEEQALYHNLCILGIVSSGLKQEGIELGRTTFRRSNNKALEYVLYRLYIIIEGRSRAQKDFKGMLPVLDKVQQAPFYQRIGDWMMELKKAGRLEPSVILPVSALKTNTSNRLVLLLLELSTVALQQDAESACPGNSQTAYLPVPGSTAFGAWGSASGIGGLLDDPLVPGEVRLGVSVTRAKMACSDFLASAALASSVCDAMEQRGLAFKKRYYELQAEIRQQEVASAEAISLPSDNPNPGAVGEASLDSMHGPADAGTTLPEAAGVDLPSGPGSAAQLHREQRSRGAAGTQPNPETLATMSSLLAGLKAHLEVHQELSAALMTEGRDANEGSGAADGRRQGSLAMGTASGGGLRFGQPQQQMLHPYQIDGRMLATEALTAAAVTDAASRGSGGCGAASFEQAVQRRQQQRNMLMPYGPDNVVKAFMSFASLLSSLAPHVTQLAMAGENAGPPPLLQPRGHPNGHAAHVAHQLQVHGNASRQIAQLSRKVQEQAVARVSTLRALRLESGRAIAQRCDLPGHDAVEDDFLDVGPHLALPPVLPLPTRPINAPLPAFVSSPRASGFSAVTGSSGAPSAVVMGSPCPSSVGVYLPGAMTSGASACGSAGTVAPGPEVVATSTTAAPPDDGLAKLHARMRNLNIIQPPGVVTTGAAAMAQAAGAEAPASATSARAAAGAAQANADLGMYSPNITLQGIGVSPMAMSGVAAARPPLSPPAQTSYDLSMLAAPAMVGSTVGPLQHEAGQHSKLQPSAAPVSGSATFFPQQQARAGEASRGAAAGSDAGGSSATACAAAWGSAVGTQVGEQAMAAPQAWATAFGRMQQQQTPPPAPPQPPLAPSPEAGPSSRRALDALFLKHQQQTQSQQQQQRPASSTSGAEPAPWGLGLNSGGGACSTSGKSASQQWQRLDAEALRATSGGNAGPLPTGAWDASQAGIGAALFGGGAGGGSMLTTRGSTAAPLAAVSGGRPASCENSRRLYLGSLLDDDEDEEKDGGHSLGGQRAGGPFAEAVRKAIDSKTSHVAAAPSTGFHPNPSASLAGPNMFGGTSSSTTAPGALQADADDDFGALAAEGELVSQVLMFGSAAAPTAGPLADGGSGAWGSFSGGVTDDRGGDGDRGRGAPAGGASETPKDCSPGGFGLMDVDYGDDVVMTDNDKDAGPGFDAKGPAGSWLTAGAHVAAGPGVLHDIQEGGNMCNAFGALVSPHAVRGLGWGQQQPAAAPPPPAAAMGAFGADIMALKARMQAALTKP